MNKYDVIVVCAGISGLLAALTLSKHGKKVLVLERSEYVGGNCNSYVVDGFQVDTGAHALTHLLVGPLKMLMDNYFDYVPVFENYGHYYIRTKDRLQKVPSHLKDFVTYNILPKKDRLVLSQGITKALTLSTFGVDLSKQSVYDSLPHNLSKDTYDFVNAISFFLSGKSMKDTSVHRMLTGSSFIRDSVTQEQFETIVGPRNTPQYTESILQSILHSNIRTSLGLKLSGILEASIPIKSTVPNPLASISRFVINSNNAQAQGYPRKGLKAVLNAVLYSLPETVETQTHCEVKRNLTNEGKVTGVETEDQAYYSDIVIYTGFAKNLPDIVEDLPVSYVNDLAGIVQTKSLTIWLGLDRKMD